MKLSVGFALWSFALTSPAQVEEKLISGPGVGLTQTKCIICHELKHITRSRLSRGEWADNLQNMRERGAPLNDQETAIILDYLTAYYGRDPAPAPVPDTLAAPSTTGELNAPPEIKALLNEHACLGCHAPDKRIIGPSFKEVEGKYRGDKTASAALAAKIRKGSVGVWGQVPMPPNSGLSEAAAKRLAQWILDLK